MNRTKQLIISLIALLCCSTGVWAEGELKGLFTINDNGDKVQFSQGNLQATYDGSDWSWAFAKNQWDYIGNAAANTSINGNGTVSTNGTVDLFNVSTSATTYGIHNSTSYETYYGDFIDWGNNMGDGWRTLASNEWKYILSKRNSGSTVFSTGDACYTHATINTDGTPVNGIILFPDGVTIARSEVTSWGSVNGNSEWGTKCTSAQWTALEAKGCVFLPAAGYRYGASVSYTGDAGYYLSSTIDTWEKYEWPVCFSSNDLTPSGGTSRHLGCSVRLVKDRQLNKDADGYYLLGTVDDWRYFAAHVAAVYSGAKARMTADIDLGDDQTTIGSGNTNAANENFMFRGVFDGNGHTLTVNYNTSEGFYAPFRHIYGATIKNLHVTGSIISSGGRVGGIVCGVFGGSSTQSKIEKCRSSVVITSNCQLSNNDAESVGGIVGQVGFSSRLSIEDCIFDGEITGHVSNVIWSGLVGVLDGTVNTTRCLQAGSFNDLDNGTTSNSATIVCRWQNAATSIVTMDETYYIHPFKTVQGTQATTAQLADGTITTALNAGRTGDDAVWVQQGDRPMLKIFASEQEPEEYQQGGELNGLFTINANGDQIVFSQGNLQYLCSTTAPQWRFAEHQYDYVAFDISAYAANSWKWIDLFAHGTSGYDNGQTNFQPYVVGAAANTYYQGNLTGNADWGYNPISNGGNWRTLTRHEWIYLFSGRPNAASKYGHGSINGINGMILLPDSWTLPDGLTFTPGNQAWGKNTYTIDQWTMMEDAGAVFLPASGSCNSQGIPSESTQNQNGFYRASTAAYYLHFRQGTLQNCTASFYQYGDAVRLVKDYQLEQDCTLQQDAEGYYLLGSVQEWKDFAALVQTTPTAKARMTADIDLGDDQTMIGTEEHPYQGTFDGQGHRLTIAYNVTENYVAPFRYIANSTISNIHMEGTIKSTMAYAAGVVAAVHSGTANLSKCYSSIQFNGNSTEKVPDWEYFYGGLVGQVKNNGTQLILNDCMYDGNMTVTTTPNSAGANFIGVIDHAHANLTNCLATGTFSNIVHYNSGYHWYYGTGTFTNTYYLNANYTITDHNDGGMHTTSDQLANGTIATALQAGHEEEVWVQDPQTNQPMLKIFMSQKQDDEDYYLLGSVQDWKDFAALVQTTPTAKARMTADIDLGTEITMIAEDLDHPYKGTFDGQGHTLTVNWTADGEDRVAPFRYAEGATIQRLHVDGSISKTGALGRCPAGILACSIGNATTTISECWSSVSLYAFDTIGGLLSVACGNSTTNIVDCVFSGMISASNSSGCSGGFASHADKEYQYNTPGTPTINITRGLNLGTFSGGNTLSYTFIRMGNPVFGTHTVNSCYYKNVYGNAQGAQATTAQLSDGTITTALNAGRTGDDAVWVQQDDQPMLKIFTQESDPVEPTGWENGVLPGEFTINTNGDQIVFSQGNLQYQATTDTWRFAINQYDFVGAGNANISDTYDGWIDLIQWGAGNNPTTTATYKYQTFVEFGSHPISNGGNVADAWRTLTKDEWVYIFRDRTNAESLFAFGSVNGVNGLIILPDNWTTPDGLTFSPSTEHGLTWLTSDGYYKSNTADGFSHNVYTLEQWTTMENQGAVFLPAAGIRYIGTKNLQKLGTEGYYWSSDKTSSDHAYVAGFGANILNPQHNGMQDYGQSIRLVQAANSKPTYLVGDANGNGEVEIGDVTSVLTLMATPEATGYNNQAADANGNGEIEIGDVTTILTIMANGE